VASVLVKYEHSQMNMRAEAGGFKQNKVTFGGLFAW